MLVEFPREEFVHIHETFSKPLRLEGKERLWRFRDRESLNLFASALARWWLHEGLIPVTYSISCSGDSRFERLAGNYSEADARALLAW